MNFITLKNITKSFNGVDVLKDINLTIDEGETLGILGRSGSGKSVLINMLRGTLDYKPDSGKVLMNVAVCPNCLTIEPPSKEGCWNPHKKRHPMSQDKEEASMRQWDRCNHSKIKSHTCQVGDPQTGE
jgi:ABC-type glutathione transport system ATPase component